MKLAAAVAVRLWFGSNVARKVKTTPLKRGGGGGFIKNFTTDFHQIKVGRPKKALSPTPKSIRITLLLGSTSKSLLRLNTDKHWIWNLNNCPIAAKTRPTLLQCNPLFNPRSLSPRNLNHQNPKQKKDICEVLWFRRIWRETHSGDQWAKSCW